MTNPLHEALFAPLAVRADPVLHLPDGGRITGRDFHARIGRAVNALATLGLAPGDRLAVQVPKSPDALAVYGAALAAGVVFLPLNTAYTADEVAYFVGDSGVSVLLADPAHAADLAPVAQRTGARLLTLGAAGEGSFAELSAAQAPEYSAQHRTEEDLAALLYTSGTTGRSKGAMLSQGNLLSNARALADAWRFTSEDVLLHALPIFHTHGLFVATNVSLITGGSMILLPRFDLDDVIRLLPEATTMMGVPTFYTRLLEDARFTRDLVGHLRLFTCGSAPLLAETHRAFEARTGHRILERYGMTETNMTTSNPYEGERRAGTVGPPLPGVELRITDPDSGALLEQGETGMIEVRGPNVFQGYWNIPEKTREEFREDGFFITGDLGCIDADGYVQIVGRQKDLIITGGYNVYPKEVELELDAAPGVLESAVIGVPHPDLGEAVLAVLVPEPGARPDPDAIAQGLRDHMARFKQPRAMVLRDALPRNTMGKVQKARLREEYAGHFAG